MRNRHAAGLGEALGCLGIRLGSVPRALLPQLGPAIIDELREQTEHWYEHRTGEVYLTDAINAYAANHAVYGQVIQGHWYDTGNPGDYLVAQFASALTHREYGPMLRELARDLDSPASTDPTT